MIITIFIELALFILNTILLIFPYSAGFPAEWDSSLAFIGSKTGIFTPILPYATIATIVSLIIIYEIAVFFFKAVRWALSFIPFFGGKG